MGNLLSYSGISTKIRAMQSKLTSEEQILEILELSNVPQVATYLKKTPEYSEIWASLDETTSHRGLLEKSLKASIFHNFSKIYQFATRNSVNSWIFIPDVTRSVCSRRS